jgi:peptidoglycan/LPS O-acetylase OafA/YrhL
LLKLVFKKAFQPKDPIGTLLPAFSVEEALGPGMMPTTTTVDNTIAAVATEFAVEPMQAGFVAEPPKTSKNDKPRDYIPQLDGLRALAVLFVLVAHGLDSDLLPSVTKYTGFGAAGVLIFFVISGFLISRILIRSKDSPNYLFNFYARRGLRIWPLYYAVLVLSFGLWRFGPPQHSVTGGIHVWVYLVYLQNLVYGHKVVPVGLGPTWTLAVEEQFYLAWPIVVYFSSKRTLRWLCLISLVASPIIRFSNYFDSWNTLCQLDALAVGALFACEYDHSNPWLKVSRYVVFMLPLGMYLQVSSFGWLTQWLSPKLFQIYGGAALVMLTIHASTLAASVFANSILRYIGRISYGIYLFNVFVFATLEYLLPSVKRSASLTVHIIFFLVGSLLTVAVASLSYSLFERPLLRLKKYFSESLMPTL